MRRNLDVGTMRSFTAVVDAGGVTRAASRLNLTQSAVSMQLKRLEQSLDTTLLDRAGRGVSLTNEGEQLLEYARKMIALNDEAVDRMIAPQFEGTVAFGIPSDLIYPHGPEILSRFDRDFPRVRVNFVSSYTTKLLDELNVGKLDVILTTEAEANPDAECLAVLPLVWCGAPGGKAWMRDPLSFASARHCNFRPVAQAALDEQGIAWRTSVDTETDLGATMASAADLSIMALLEGSYDDRLEPIAHNGKLPPLPNFSINLYIAENTANEDLGREFGRYVREAYAA